MKTFDKFKSRLKTELQAKLQSAYQGIEDSINDLECTEEEGDELRNTLVEIEKNVSRIFKDDHCAVCRKELPQNELLIDGPTGRTVCQPCEDLLIKARNLVVGTNQGENQ